MLDMYMRVSPDYDVQMRFPDPVIKAGAPTGEIEITSNGVYDVESYASANVAVPEPSGTITITENGTGIDIAQYATADVNIISAAEVPLYVDINNGFVGAGTPTNIWNISDITSVESDVYRVQAHHTYFLATGISFGNRFRSIIVENDPVIDPNSQNGLQNIAYSSPNTQSYVEFTANSSGYLIISKTTGYETGYKTYLYDVSNLP